MRMRTWCDCLFTSLKWAQAIRVPYRKARRRSLNWSHCERLEARALLSANPLANDTPSVSVSCTKQSETEWLISVVANYPNINELEFSISGPGVSGPAALEQDGTFEMIITVDPGATGVITAS